MKLVLWTCQQVDPVELFNPSNGSNTALLTQPTILSLLQQLSQNLNEDTEIKTRYDLYIKIFMVNGQQDSCIGVCCHGLLSWSNLGYLTVYMYIKGAYFGENLFWRVKDFLILANLWKKNSKMYSLVTFLCHSIDDFDENFFGEWTKY